MGTSGLWEVMTAQEAADFVHQCRHCRPHHLSCSQALTLEAHTRWKLRFSKVTHNSTRWSLACLAWCCMQMTANTEVGWLWALILWHGTVAFIVLVVRGTDL